MSRRTTSFGRDPCASSSSRQSEVCAQSKYLPCGLATAKRICLTARFEPHKRRPFRSQLFLHRFKLGATSVAELSQWIFAVSRTKLDLLGGEIRLRVCVEDNLYDLFGLCQHA